MRCCSLSSVNDFGFAGNNGLTDFKDILGFNVQATAPVPPCLR